MKAVLMNIWWQRTAAAKFLIVMCAIPHDIIYWFKLMANAARGPLSLENRIHKCDQVDTECSENFYFNYLLFNSKFITQRLKIN